MSASRNLLLAVDTNVVYDLAVPREEALDAFELLKRRLNPEKIIIPPTAFAELEYIAESSDPIRSPIAESALDNLRRFGLEVAPSVAVPRETLNEIAREFERMGLIPIEERHDSLILAEAAVLGCGMLLSSDSHLRSIDFQRAEIAIIKFGFRMPAVASPRELLAKFG